MQNGARNKSNRSLLARTIALMLIFGLGTFAVLGVKLYSISVTQHDKLQKQAMDQQTRSTVITPNRGTIYDRNMNVIAMSVSMETVFLDPHNIKTDEQRELIANGLSVILGIDREKLLEQTKRDNRYEIVAKKVDKEAADLIRAFIVENKLGDWVGLDPDSKRVYPNNNFASTVLGFVGTDNNGLDGLEAKYESDLQGTPGQIVVARDAKGSSMPTQYEMYYDASDGSSLRLTIDESIQHFLEKHLETAVIENQVSQRACGIVMDVKTGGILAMATKGDYDLNNPFVITDEEVRAEIEALTGTEEFSAKRAEALQSQWRNKAVSDTYEPGSTFKMFTAAMAIEENAVGDSDHFNCAGSVKVGKWTINCHKRAGHGSQNFLEAMMHSCNPAFIAIGNRVGPEKFYSYMQAFGFMDMTNVDLPGETSNKGLVHPYEVYNRDPAAQAVYAFGQTFKITPIQLITAVSAVANGGYLMKPYVVQDWLDQEGSVVKSTSPTVVRQPISTETSKKLCLMLEQVVCNPEGGGKNAYIKGYRIAGKTGTSQKRDVVGASEQGLYVTSFVGFAPADNPEIAILIMLDEPGGPRNLRMGGYMAAPVARRVLADALPYLGIAPQYSADDLTGVDVAVPNIKGKSVEEAKKLLKYAGLEATVEGAGDVVLDQVPVYGVKVPSSAKIILYTEGEKPGEKIAVPDLAGKTPEQVNTALASLGLYMKATGANAVTSSTVKATWQDYQAGEEVVIGTVIQVEFSDSSVGDYGTSTRSG